MKRDDPLLEQVLGMLGRYLPQDARHIVVALSGGADSVCLLHALLSLKPLHGCTLSAVHLNHLLRGQAAFEDAAFVEALCQKLGVELLSEQADVAALGVEKREVVVSYQEGDTVRITDGALESFLGTVEEIDLDRSKVRVVVSMFGRETPVELELDQVEPAN